MKARIESLWAEARIWVEIILSVAAIVFGGFLIWLAAAWYTSIHFLLGR